MNKATAELEIKISNGRITNATVLENHICKLTIETMEKSSNANLEGAFELIEASKLSLDDELMKYKPRTIRQGEFKERLTGVIKSGIKDFWYPKYDPSFDEERTGICYVPGKEPAVGKPRMWWDKIAEALCPERDSQLCLKSERIAFAGIFIKKLIESGWKEETAWYAVCDDSEKFGGYYNSKGAKQKLEDTGSGEVCGLFDLGNTYKLLAYDEEIGGFWEAGGSYDCYGDISPLADIKFYGPESNNMQQTVGLIVLHKSATNL